jgi:enoyl-CoA hydratase/carnithine racemase
MTSKGVTIDRQGRVAVVRFDAGGSGNAINLSLVQALEEAAISLKPETGLCAVIIAGGEKNFTVGMDLKDDELKETRAEDVDLAARRQTEMALPNAMKAFADLDAVTIAAIEGWCIGGGAALALRFDLRVFAEDAKIYFPEVERGMTLPGGTLARLVSLVGPARAMRLALLAERLEAASAADWGLADEIAPPGQALAKARDMAERLAAQPPLAVRGLKRGIADAAAQAEDATIEAEIDQFLEMLDSDDHAEAVAAFLEKRDAVYRGR